MCSTSLRNFGSAGVHTPWSNYLIVHPAIVTDFLPLRPIPTIWHEGAQKMHEHLGNLARRKDGLLVSTTLFLGFIFVHLFRKRSSSPFNDLTAPTIKATKRGPRSNRTEVFGPSLLDSCSSRMSCVGRGFLEGSWIHRWVLGNTSGMECRKLKMDKVIFSMDRLDISNVFLSLFPPFPSFFVWPLGNASKGTARSTIPILAMTCTGQNMRNVWMNITWNTRSRIWTFCPGINTTGRLQMNVAPLKALIVKACAR